jgi:hypothetical protein
MPENQFKFNQCGQSFNSQAELEDHSRTSHSGYVPFLFFSKTKI